MNVYFLPFITKGQSNSSILFKECLLLLTIIDDDDNYDDDDDDDDVNKIHLHSRQLLLIGRFRLSIYVSKSSSRFKVTYFIQYTNVSNFVCLFIMNRKVNYFAACFISFILLDFIVSNIWDEIYVLIYIAKLELP